MKAQHDVKQVIQVAGKLSQIKAPDQTLEEVRYLRHLIDNKVPVRVKLIDNEIVDGVIEFYDTTFIRLSRENGPNLFLYKHDIKYFHELGE